jgi:hypothetical protein
MQRRWGTYRRWRVAKSGKSEKGQIAVNSSEVKLISMREPG